MKKSVLLLAVMGIFLGSVTFVAAQTEQPTRSTRAIRPKGSVTMVKKAAADKDAAAKRNKNTNVSDTGDINTQIQAEGN